MKYYLKFALISLLTTTAFPALILADDVKINQKFTGVSHPTMVDTNGDGIYAGVSTFQVTGSPGRATIQAVGELGPMGPGDDPCDLQGEFVQESFVETFNDGSMLFFEVTGGYSCVIFEPFEIFSELTGIITGGVGRFESSTGTWTIEAEAIPVGQTQTVFVGTMKGTVEIPD